MQFICLKSKSEKWKTGSLPAPIDSWLPVIHSTASSCSSSMSRWASSHWSLKTLLFFFHAKQFRLLGLLGNGILCDRNWLALSEIGTRSEYPWRIQSAIILFFDADVSFTGLFCCVPVKRTTFYIFYWQMLHSATQLKEIDKSFLNKHKDPVAKNHDYAKNENTKERETTFLAEFWREWDGDPNFDQFLFLLSAFLYFSFAMARGNTRRERI